MRNLKKFNKALSSFFEGQVKWAAGLLENPTGKPKRVKRVRKVEAMEWDEVAPVHEKKPEAEELPAVEPEIAVAKPTEVKEPEPEEIEKPRATTALPPKRERADKLKPVVLTSRGQQKEKERFQTKSEPTEAAVPKIEKAPAEKPKSVEPVAEAGKNFEAQSPKEEDIEDIVVTESAPAVTTRGAKILLGAIYVLAIAGLLIFLMALKIMTQSMHSEDLERQIQALRDEADKKSDYKDTIIAPPEVLRGQVILRSGTSNTRSQVPKVSIMLYTKAQVEEALKNYQEEVSSAPGDFAKIRFPAAISRTISDSEGFYSLDIPEQGSYVLMARVNVPKKGTRMWLLEVDTKDRLNTPIDLTDLNRLASPTKAPIVNVAR